MTDCNTIMHSNDNDMQAHQHSPQSLAQFLGKVADATEQGQIDEATDILAQAAQYLVDTKALSPEDAFLWKYFGIYLIFAGEMGQGVDLLQKMIKIVPWNDGLHSELLLNLHFLPHVDPKVIFEEHERWARIHASKTEAFLTYGNTPDPDRGLRVGYISPNFYCHPVAVFFESLLEGHNREKVEAYGYGNVANPDQTTERLKSKFVRYRDIRGLSDSEVARLIEDDRIDILVDLAGHVSGNCLGVMTYKPAPIAVTYLGYPNTTGMEQIDYRMTDRITNSSQQQQFYTEELTFLRGCFTCYKPPLTAPPLAALPAVKKGYVTFGSFNNNCKINPYIMSLWAQVLRANEGSRFLLRFAAGKNQETREHYLRQFEQFGVEPQRVYISGWENQFEHLQMYNQVDIVLDSYPWNGHATTCEALWMGVPVISLVGESHVSRFGLTILTCLDMQFFAASTSAEYVAKATALAQNLDALADIRASMRQRMTASILCDANAFARNVEEEYRKMWHRWCRSNGVNIPGEESDLDNQLSGTTLEDR